MKVGVTVDVFFFIATPIEGLFPQNFLGEGTSFMNE